MYICIYIYILISIFQLYMCIYIIYAQESISMDEE